MSANSSEICTQNPALNQKVCGLGFAPPLSAAVPGGRQRWLEALTSGSCAAAVTLCMLLLPSQRAREPLGTEALLRSAGRGDPSQGWEEGLLAPSGCQLFSSYLVRAQQCSQGKSCLMKKAAKFEERKPPRFPFPAQHLVAKEMWMVQCKPGCKRETETPCCLGFSLVPVPSSPLCCQLSICAPLLLQTDQVWRGRCQGWTSLQPLWAARCQCLGHY